MRCFKNLIFWKQSTKIFKIPLDKRRKLYYTVSVKQRRTFSVLTLRRIVPGLILEMQRCCFEHFYVYGMIAENRFGFPHFI